MEKKMKGNMLNYKKKKETIKKKTRELSILCDIKACVILVDPDGEVDTWPENPTDFNPIIQSYKENLFNGKRKRIDDDGCFEKKSKKNHALFCDDGEDQWLNDVFRESNESLLVKLNSKLEAVERRIEFLKMMNYGNGVVGGSISSEKESLLANQETHNSDFEVAINGDRFENSSAYNQETEIAMAAELWVIAGDESAHDHGQEIDFLRGNATLNNLNNV
ncbi:agamous-like MADS-box protein AGL82 [Solanum stenotomum]|uniref:agamous-like MADS-box protein AGL82 n=1 Tax=Solanum stenotomum TaxID=172797 RepID=UPI0020D03416|nr:agamous-like MADS-box protein AGL82 [Solanum stenotomum]